MTPSIRLAVVDDHPLMRIGVEHILGQEEDFEIVGSGQCADDAVRIARELAPNIMLLDVNMPGGGVAAASEIIAAQPFIRILFLTVSERPEDVTAALDAGVRGYILKGISGPDLVRTIRSVGAGETYITPQFAARLLTLQNRPAAASPSRQDDASRLNHREAQVLKELSLGLTNKEIAKKLNLTEKTIKHYMTGVLQKLSVRNRVEAVLASRTAQGGR